jgi:hypothetical protein
MMSGRGVRRRRGGGRRVGRSPGCKDYKNSRQVRDASKFLL